MFFQQLSTTRRGARLARHLATHQLDVWGIRFGSELSDTVALIVAELSSNAVLHARVPGRDFALRLEHRTDALRIEVADARGDRSPVAAAPTTTDTTADHDHDHGRGLVIVDALASRWGVTDRRPGPGKVVWAEIDLP
ncbi:ATP-binding protein [Streptomyces sp. NPDC048581]|uniref:ATP-binding protein n=1 Tax=Streptomyces sp. NPDC048581 TaxID=3365572 RepID=UPI00371E936C